MLARAVLSQQFNIVPGVVSDITPQSSSPGQPFTKVEGMNQRYERTISNVPQTALVLDSGATIHFFSNERMMKNIHDGDKPVKIHCGGKYWN